MRRGPKSEITVIVINFKIKNLPTFLTLAQILGGKSKIRNSGIKPQTASNTVPQYKWPRRPLKLLLNKFQLKMGASRLSGHST